MGNQHKNTIIQLSLRVSLTIVPLVTTCLNLEAIVQMSSHQEINQLNSQSFPLQSKLTIQSKKEESETKSEPLDFSSLGRSGQQTAGESRGNCPPINLPLAAIAPKNNESKTISSHPQWWFYIPYNSSQISKVEFVLQDEARKDIIRESIALPETLPYLNTTMPKTHSGIKPNNWYRWYLKVYCLKEEDSVPLFVSGWVQRVTLESPVHTIESEFPLTVIYYAQQDLWLDAINVLLSTQISSSGKGNLFQVWRQIIGSPDIDLELPLPKTGNIVTK